MNKKISFGLLYFVSFIVVVISPRTVTKFSEHKAVKLHKKIMMIFIKTMDIELIPNGKYMDDPFYKIEYYSIVQNPGIEDFMKLCIEVLQEFDKNLSIKPNEVVFLSFYYKMLRWLNYHLSQIQDIKVFNPNLTNLVNDIITKRQISEDIKAAFDRRIYEVKIPKQLSLYGEEVDLAIKLIYDIEVRHAEINDSTHIFNDGEGGKRFHALICCYFVECKKIEVYENFIRRLDNNNEDYGNYEVINRKLELIGLIDIVLIFFRGDYKKVIDYEEIDLSKHTRGTIAHFKYASILFIRAVEKIVFNELGELIGVLYQFQKAYIENFSTRDKAFHLRLCALNGQVSIILNSIAEKYLTYTETLRNSPIKVTFYRLLKWLSKYSKFRACSYTESKINEMLPIFQEYIPLSDDILNTRIPRGINTLEQLIEFGTNEKTETNIESFCEEDDNYDTFVPEDEPLQNDVDLPEKKVEDLWPDDPAENMEVIHENKKALERNPSNRGTQSTNTSYVDLQYWIDTIGSIIGPSLSNFKTTMMDKVKSFF